MEYVIGIDGGGTKTRLIAAGRGMELLYEAFGGGTGLSSLPEDVVRHNLLVLIENFFAKSGLPRSGCRGVCVGSAGAGRRNARKKLEEILNGVLPGFPLLVTTDARGALRGGADSGVGLLLLAVTGSICYGMYEAGDTWRAGGCGHIMGDEGSGYDMSRKILQAVACQADGRGKPTALTELVLEHWKLSGVDELVEELYYGKNQNCDVAGLAFLCDIAYNKGDRTALRIMREVAASLRKLAIVAAEKLWEPESPVRCVCAGGLLENSPNLKAHVREELERKRPNITVTSPQYCAAWGCAALAWEQNFIGRC